MSNHVIRAQQFDRERLTRHFRAADRIRAAFEHPLDDWNRGHVRKLLHGKLLNYMFWQESTRTRLSFSNGAQHLGMQVEGSDSAGKFSSAAKGESLEHTVRIICEYYPDVIVLRHDAEGAALTAAKVVDHFRYSTCIINAGDGPGEHPTQALLDLYAMWRERGVIDGAHIVIGGDLLYGRTVRSLAQLLPCYQGVKITFVSPQELRLRADITAYLTARGVQFEELDDVEDVLPVADMFYWTRIQTNLMKDKDLVERMQRLQKQRFRLDMGRVANMRRDALVFHPMPINGEVNEIAPEVDHDYRAAYIRQAGGGLFSRMALLCELLGVNLL